MTRRHLILLLTGLISITVLAVKTAEAFQNQNAFSIQVASVTSEEAAKQAISSYHKRGVSAYYVKANLAVQGTFFRIRVGRFGSYTAAQTYGQQLQHQGLISSFFVVNFNGPSNSPFSQSSLLGPIAGGASRKEEPRTSASRQIPKETPKPTSAPPTVAKTTAPGAAAPKARAAQAQPSRAPVAKPETLQAQAPKPPAPNPEPEATQEQSSRAPVAKPETLQAQAPKPPAPNLEPEATQEQSSRAPVAKPETLQAQAPKPPAPNPEPEAAQEQSSRAPIAKPETLHARLIGAPIPKPEVIQAQTKPAPQNDLSTQLGQWKRQSSPTTANLYKVFFVNETTGWAVGDEGTILHTNNGGQSWQQQQSGVQIRLNNVFFVDEKTGWAIGGGTVGEDLRELLNQEELLLLYTTDGGVTWKKKTGVNALALYFQNRRSGWLAGNYGSLMRTSDGGASWKEFDGIESLLGGPVKSRDFVFAFSSISFVDKRNGWLIGNLYGESAAYLGGIFRTQDGGATWQKQSLKVTSSAGTDSPVAGMFKSIHFTDAQTGVVCGEIVEGDQKYLIVLHTSDGGRSWRQYKTPIRGYYATSFVDAKNGWSVSAIPEEDGSTNLFSGTIMKTSNGGISWKEEFKVNSGGLFDIYFVTANRGWIVGEQGIILRYEIMAPKP